MRGAWGDDVRVVLAGLTNTYSSYITTFEEYGVQRYEGASTIFGPHTLDAYIQARPTPLNCLKPVQLMWCVKKVLWSCNMSCNCCRVLRLKPKGLSTGLASSSCRRVVR